MRSWSRQAGLVAGSAAVVLGLAGAAHAAPTPAPAPGPPATSSTDEITDMVMGAIARSGAPSTTPAPAPPG